MFVFETFSILAGFAGFVLLAAAAIVGIWATDV